MSGIEIIADTNAVIYFLAGKQCMRPYIKSRIGVSVITMMELLSYGDISVKEEEKIRAFLGKCEILDIDEDIREKTIEVRRKHRVKLPDAIIAATAIVKGIPLITADKGLQKISELLMKQIEL